MRTKTSICFILLITGIACSENPISKDLTPIEAHQLEKDSQLQLSQEQLVGSGKIRFSNPLQGVNSNEHYLIGFRFLNNESSSLTLISHFSGHHLDDGLRLLFQYNNGHLGLKISSPDYPSSVFFTLVDKPSVNEIYFRVEIHDGIDDGARILVWLDQVSYRGEVWERQTRIQLGNELFDSRKERVVFHSHGRGPFWGLELSNTALLKAQREAPYVD